MAPNTNIFITKYKTDLYGRLTDLELNYGNVDLDPEGVTINGKEPGPSPVTAPTKMFHVTLSDDSNGTKTVDVIMNLPSDVELPADEFNRITDSYVNEHTMFYADVAGLDESFEFKDFTLQYDGCGDYSVIFEGDVTEYRYLKIYQA